MISYIRSMGWLIAVDVGGGLITSISLGIIPFSLLKYALYMMPLLLVCALIWCHLRVIFKKENHDKGVPKNNSAKNDNNNRNTHTLINIYQ